MTDQNLSRRRAHRQAISLRNIRALVKRPPPAGNLNVSFEFFPPKNDAGLAAPLAAIKRLAVFQPRFVSVTYGAGGTTKTRTHRLVKAIQKESDIPAAAHLTCVGASRAEVDAIAKDYWDAGIRRIIALRGDPQQGSQGYLPHPDGYAYAADLVAGLKRIADFDISVAAYPEVHPEALSKAADMDNLKRKLDAGADRAITQFFFDSSCYLRFRDAARAAGITAPIIPGILPIVNFSSAVQFAKKCGATIPPWLAALFEGLDDDPATQQLISAVAATELCRQLRDHGVSEFHFYTLNRAELVDSICRLLRAPVPITDGASEKEWRNA